MTRPLAILAAALLGAGAAAEPPPACPLSNAQFEAAAPHLDLDRRPASLEGPGRFRRATVSQAALHVFVFSVEGVSACWRSAPFRRSASRSPCRARLGRGPAIRALDTTDRRRLRMVRARATFPSGPGWAGAPSGADCGLRISCGRGGRA